MVTRDGGFADLKGVILDTTDRGLVRFKFANASGETFAQYDKFGHNQIVLGAALFALNLFKSNGFLPHQGAKLAKEASGIVRAGRSFGMILDTKDRLSFMAHPLDGPII